MPTKKDFPFRIGADPEFNLLINDRHFCASSLLSNMFDRKLEKKDLGFEIPNAGEIGWDGNDDIAELRPLPEYTPEKLTDNLKKLINKIVKNNKLLELSTLCDMGTVGGHIHLELSEKNKSNTTLHENISRKLGSFYLPIILSEDKLNLKTRDKNNYGKLTDFRVDCRDDEYTFEFRTPSAEWLTTERITSATLAYIATVYNEIMHHPKNFSKCNALIFKNQNQANALRNLAISDFRIIMKNLTSKIKKYVRNFEFYQQYKNEIDFILSADKVSKEKQKVNYNIAIGWNMVKYKQPNKRQLFSRITTKNTINIDNITQLIPLYYNPDTNVAEFAQAMKTKIASLNWKTKKHYFLFGLKKGINDFIIANKNSMENLTFLYGQEQIKTRNDLYHIIETFKRMNSKFPYIKKRNQPKNETSNKEYVIIGIPYDLRMGLKIKPLIEHIYNIEKGRLEITKNSPINIPLPEEITINGKKSFGEITEIYSEIKTENLESTISRTTEATAVLEAAAFELENENMRHEEII